MVSCVSYSTSCVSSYKIALHVCFESVLEFSILSIIFTVTRSQLLLHARVPRGALQLHVSTRLGILFTVILCYHIKCHCEQQFWLTEYLKWSFSFIIVLTLLKTCSTEFKSGGYGVENEVKPLSE